MGTRRPRKGKVAAQASLQAGGQAWTRPKGSASWTKVLLTSPVTYSLPPGFRNALSGKCIPGLRAVLVDHSLCIVLSLPGGSEAPPRWERTGAPGVSSLGAPRPSGHVSPVGGDGGLWLSPVLVLWWGECPLLPRHLAAMSWSLRFFLGPH